MKKGHKKPLKSTKQTRETLHKTSTEIDYEAQISINSILKDKIEDNLTKMGQKKPSQLVRLVTCVIRL